MPLDPNVTARLQVPQGQPFNPLATLTQLGELRNQALERQQRQQQIESAQTIEKKRLKDEQDQAQLEQLIAANPDRNTLREAIRTHAPNALAAFDKSIADLDEKAALAQSHVAATRKSQIDAANALQSYMAGIGAQIASHDYSPVAFVAGARHLTDQFPELQGQVQAALDQVRNGTPIKTIVDGLMAQNPATQKQFNEAPGQVAQSGMQQQIAANMQGGMTAEQRSQAAQRQQQLGIEQQNAQTSRGQLSVAQQREERERRMMQTAPDVSGDVRTTVTGQKYIDLGDYETPTARQKAREAAKQQGVNVVDKTTGDSLRAADTARLNLQAMWGQIQSKLPKDPSGRIVAGPENKLSKFFQTDPEIAAFNSWRAGAIQAVQALVEKGMGFRLNQAEINMIMQNDMPQITDTVGTAQKRIDNVMKLLSDKESVALTKDRSTLSGGGTVKMRAPNGDVADVPADQVEAFKKKGATVIR